MPRRVKQNVCFNSTGSQLGTVVQGGGGWVAGKTICNHRKKQPPGVKKCSRLYCITDIGGGCVCYLEKSSNIITFMSSTELSPKCS